MLFQQQHQLLPTTCFISGTEVMMYIGDCKVVVLNSLNFKFGTVIQIKQIGNYDWIIPLESNPYWYWKQMWVSLDWNGKLIIHTRDVYDDDDYDDNGWNDFDEYIDFSKYFLDRNQNFIY